MILKRLGNKREIADKIQQYFSPHDIFIDIFFGAGGMFFNKKKVKNNIVNDIDSDVFNLFWVILNKKKELEDLFYKMPIHQDLLEYWKSNKEIDKVKKALRFLFISNLTYLGKGDTLPGALGNNKKSFYKLIDKTYEMLSDVKFFNKDFRKFIKSLAIGGTNMGQKRILMYADSPYLGTDNNYEGYKKWEKKDVVDLFNCLQATKCNFALSEFDHPFILEQVKKRNLNIIIIGKRRNIKNERIEILITNYNNVQIGLFN